MGIVNFSIPEQETMWIKKEMNLTTVIEGETYQGETAKRLSKEFKTVFTIQNQ